MYIYKQIHLNYGGEFQRMGVPTWLNGLSYLVETNHHLWMMTEGTPMTQEAFIGPPPGALKEPEMHPDSRSRAAACGLW